MNVSGNQKNDGFLPNIASIHGLVFTQGLALMVFRRIVACDSARPLLS